MRWIRSCVWSMMRSGWIGPRCRRLRSWRGALLAERVAMLFSVRVPDDVNELTGLPGLLVGGLADEDARWLLGSALPGRLDEHVRDQIVAETRGNPSRCWSCRGG